MLRYNNVGRLKIVCITKGLRITARTAMANGISNKWFRRSKLVESAISADSVAMESIIDDTLKEYCPDTDPNNEISLISKNTSLRILSDTALLNTGMFVELGNKARMVSSSIRGTIERNAFNLGSDG